MRAVFTGSQTLFTEGGYGNVIAASGGGGGGSGTVTSVSMSAPAFLTVGGSPVTTSGTLALSLSGAALPVTSGGTGGTTAAGARTALGLAIGTDVQAFSANYTTAASTYGTDNLLLRSDGTGRGTQASAITVDDSGNMSGVGTLSLGTALPIASGGTNATTAAGARSALGLAIGSDVQAFNANFNTAAATFSVDNAVLRADGTGRGTQSSPVVINDAGDVSGVNDFAATGTFTIDTLTATTLNVTNLGAPLSGANGGTGVANTGKTVTLGGNIVTAGALTTSGANALTLTTTGTTTAALPVGTVNIGYLEIPQGSHSADYTGVLADSAKHLFHPTADNNARTFTIPANGSVAYPVGTAISFVNQINTLSIAITTDTLTLFAGTGTGTTGTRTLAAGGVATALKVSSTGWIIWGVGLT